jgi:Uma2 family endonuclease
MTADDFFALGETENRYELIDGVLVMSPSPTMRHQNIMRAILRQLEQMADRTPGLQIAVDVDIEFSPAVVYRPDLAVYRAGRVANVPERLREAPDLVIEILSPGTKARDLATKRADYERFGVAEYWTVDQSGGAIRCWRRSGPGFQEAAVTGDALPSAAIQGFTLDLRTVRAMAVSK